MVSLLSRYMLALAQSWVVCSQDQGHTVKPLSKCLLGLEQSYVNGDMETSMSRGAW